VCSSCCIVCETIQRLKHEPPLYAFFFGMPCLVIGMFRDSLRGLYTPLRGLQRTQPRLEKSEALAHFNILAASLRGLEIFPATSQEHDSDDDALEKKRDICKPGYWWKNHIIPGARHHGRIRC
jgi:hypothetical protein